MNTYEQHQNASRVPEVVFAIPTRSYYQTLLLGWSIYKLRHFSSHLHILALLLQSFFCHVVEDTELQNISCLFCFSSST